MLKPPADVDIVAGLLKMGIKPVDRLKSLTAECHVATGDVLGDLVAHEHVGRLPGAAATQAASQPSSGVRFGPPDRRRPAMTQLVDQMDQPVRVCHAVGIRVSDHGTRCGSEPGISRYSSRGGVDR